MSTVKKSTKAPRKRHAARRRKVVVYLDEQDVADLKNGKPVIIPLPPGDDNSKTFIELQRPPAPLTAAALGGH
jgi:hypothetical protein